MSQSSPFMEALVASGQAYAWSYNNRVMQNLYFPLYAGLFTFAASGMDSIQSNERSFYRPLKIGIFTMLMGLLYHGYFEVPMNVPLIRYGLVGLTSPIIAQYLTGYNNSTVLDRLS